MGAFYLHIPFCRAKCLYCDFFSTTGSDDEIDAYTALLIDHIGLLKRLYPDSPSLNTVYFGGGTPSLLSVDQVFRIINHLEQNFGINQKAEITIEANPGALCKEKLQGYRSIGINRLSLGIQSMDDCQLKFLGRIHSALMAKEAFLSARSAGFDNISLDLIFALPGQSLKDLRKEAGQLLALQPEHISLYGLSIEEGTAFFEMEQLGRLSRCDDDLYADQYRLLHDLLSEAGFDHYEISNFARPGLRSRHNQEYWRRSNCQAVGCEAHSFIDRGWGERWYIPGNLAQYRRDIDADRNPARKLESFNQTEAMKETAYLALRTSDGISSSGFRSRFGHDPDKIFSAAFERCGSYIQKTGDRIHMTLDGWLIYDSLISNFL